MNKNANVDMLNLNTFYSVGQNTKSIPDSLFSPILTSNDGMKIVLRPINNSGKQRIEFVNADGTIDHLYEMEAEHIANAYKDHILVFERLKTNPLGFEMSLDYFSIVKEGKYLCLEPVGDSNLSVARNLNTWHSSKRDEMEYLANMADEFNLDKEVSHFPLQMHQALADSILETLKYPVISEAEAVKLHDAIVNAKQNKGEYESSLGYVCRTLDSAFN